MAITCAVYIDWDKDTNFTDMSSSVLSVTGRIGRHDWKQRTASVGTCRIELNNESGNFSPLNASSPYYGQMVPNIPVQVKVTDGAGTHQVFTMWTTAFVPQPFSEGLRKTHVYCVDRMGQLQAADISLPIQEDETAGAIIRKICSTVYESGQGSAAIYMRSVADTHTLTIGDKTYTFVDALTPTANEVALESQDYFYNELSGGGGITDSAVSAAATINRDEGNGTVYADTTVRHPDVSAVGYMGIGWDESNYDSDYDLQRTGTAYEALAASFSWNFNGNYSEPADLPMRRVYLYLKKVGTPTGTLTLRHEIPTGAGGSPSGTLYNASGTATMSEADLTTSFAWYAFDFTEYTMGNYTIDDVSYLHWLVLSTDRSASATDYVVWGGDSAIQPARFSEDRKTGGSWAGRVAGKTPLIYIPGILDVTAAAHGAWGNLALAQTGGQIVLPGAAMSGGVDGPSGAISADAGQLTFDYAGDTWVEGETNAYSAAQEMTESEFGLFWAARNGTLTFEDNLFQFEKANASADLTCSNGHTGQAGQLSRSDIINRATISYQPRQELASAVVARSTQPIFVPGRTGHYSARWNAYESKNQSDGRRTLVLPYLSNNTGDRIGAIEIVQPLTAETDYTVYGTKDKTGPEVSAKGYIKFALALVASGVQVDLTNTTGRWGWVHDLQISATGLERQATTQLVKEDATSRAAYGLGAIDYRLHYPSSGVVNFAQVLADFFIARYKDPQYLVTAISFYGIESVGGTSIFSLDISDIIALTETQTSVSGHKMLIMGIEYDLPEQNPHTVTFHVMRLPVTYAQLDDADTAKLDDTARLAI